MTVCVSRLRKVSIVLINRCFEKIYELFIRANETVCLMTSDCDRKIKTDCAKVTSAHNMGLTMYDSLCLGTQNSTGIHCPN